MHLQHTPPSKQLFVDKNLKLQVLSEPQLLLDGKTWEGTIRIYAAGQEVRTERCTIDDSQLIKQGDAVWQLRAQQDVGVGFQSAEKLQFQSVSEVGMIQGK